MRLPFATVLIAAFVVVPLISEAIPSTSTSPMPMAPRLIPEVHLPVATPAPVTGPPASPTTPTLWLKSALGYQTILSNISESMTPQGNRGCVVFTVSATLNTADAVKLLEMYNNNTAIREARIYIPPSIVYTITNGSIKSYSESAQGSKSLARLTLTEQKYTVTSGTSSDSSDCSI